MAYRLLANGLIECDTADEAIALQLKISGRIAGSPNQPSTNLRPTFDHPSQRLQKVGDGAVFAESNEAPLLPQTLAPQSGPRPKQFRARLGDRWALVELVKVDPSGAIMVKEAGVTKYGAITVLDRSCVAEEHTQQVAQWIAEATKGLQWSDGTPANAESAK